MEMEMEVEGISTFGATGLALDLDLDLQRLRRDYVSLSLELGLLLCGKCPLSLRQLTRWGEPSLPPAADPSPALWAAAVWPKRKAL